jgi:PAS domain S-box-containing protein
MSFWNRLVAPRNLSRYLLKVVIVFALHLMGGKLGDALQSISSGGIAPVWPASGIALGVVLVWGYSVWPGVAAGAFLLTLLGGLPTWAAAIYAAGTTSAALLPVFVLRRAIGFDNSLSRLRDVLGLIALGAFGGAVLSASVGVPTLYATHIYGWSGSGRAWLIYWLGDSTGVLAVTPLVLALAAPFRVHDKNWLLELAVLVLLLTSTCGMIFGILPIWLDILTFVVLPFVMWAAIRLGANATSLAIFILAAIGTVETALGHGPFRAYSPVVNAVLLDVFIGVVAITGLTLAAISAEREQSLRQQAVLETRLLDSEAIRESEDRLRLILDSTAEAVYGIDLEHRCTFCNPACLRILGYAHEEELLGTKIHDLIHYARENGTPVSLEECRVHRVPHTGEGVHADDEVMWRSNGTCFPVEYWSYPQRRGNTIIGAVVAFMDITERKRAEAATANVSRRLIEAQEQERTRIARELHDDINQQIALVTISLEQSVLRLSDNEAEIRAPIHAARERLLDLGKDVQALSRRLHSSKLDYLGLTAAARSLCKEIGEQHKVEIHFSEAGVPRDLPKQISLCLFRVLQEALQNAVKYSRARQFIVELHSASRQIQLVVKDRGVGFDLREEAKRNGLGLTSMRERLQAIGGMLSINSHVGEGTTVEACVPLTSNADQSEDVEAVG